MMSRTVPITVIIPTYNRGTAVLAVLERLRQCDPQPESILVHIDLSDGKLEREISRQFPDITVLSSSTRRGPGGGRHRCLAACKTPYAVSFDDDSYPMDADFFASVERLFQENPGVALFEANVWHRHEAERRRAPSLTPISSYIGCGYAIRVAVYRTTRGHLDRAVAYGMEELDLSLLLFASGWGMVRAGELRVFHDTELKRHRSAEITAGSIMNVALYAFLHYPATSLGLGLLQLGNKVAYLIRRGRIGGIISGLVRIPADCWRNRVYRKPIPQRTLDRFVRFCRTGCPTAEDRRAIWGSPPAP
jgi:GT2 family glycosyltransferase